MVDIGADLTNIVVHENGMPRFVRILLHGGRTITTALISELGISLAEAEQVKREMSLSDPSGGDRLAHRVAARVCGDLVDEIRGSLDYFAASSTHGSVSRVVLSGGTSGMEGLAELLSERLRIPVEYGSAFGSVAVGRSGLSPAQIRFVTRTAVVPVGLALGGAA